MIRLFFPIILLFLSHLAFADVIRVADIRIDGLQRVSASPVFAVMPIRSGDLVDSENIRDTISAVFSLGYFSNIQVARDGDVLILLVQERPAIKTIEIKGNKAIGTDVLEGILKDNGIAEGEILQRQTLQSLSRELKNQYVARARYDAEVKADIVNLPNNLVEIKLNVDEGSSSKIRHINIVGNTIYTDEELLSQFELKKAKWNSFFTKSGTYAREKLTGDIETLESYYLNRGYLDFKLLSSQVSLSPDKKSVFITLNIDEGEIYKVNKVDISGDPILPESQLSRVFLLREGDTFSQARMTGTTEYLTSMLANAGYTNAEIEGITDKNQDNNTVKVTFYFNPGKRVYVRRIEFRGNTKTNDEVLRREMRQMEGAFSSNSLIERSKVRLDRLGFFKEVKAETIDVPGSDDLVDVVYSVEEQPSGSISASLGYAKTTDLNLGLNVNEKNWLGTGSEVSFGITTNNFQKMYNFAFRDPYFTPDGVSRGFGAYYRVRDFQSYNSAGYSADAWGFNVNFGYPISEISRLSFDFGIENQQIKTADGFAPQEVVATPIIVSDSITGYVNQTQVEEIETGMPYDLDVFSPIDPFLPDIEPGFIDLYGDEFTSLIGGFNWRRSTLNRGILATRGTSQALSFELSVPGSELEYYKLAYDAQAFMPLSKSFTLRFRTSLAYGDGYGDLEELPFFENYFAGGFGSVRGFERARLGPRGSPPRYYQLQPTSSTGNEVAYIRCDDPDSGTVLGNCVEDELINPYAATRSNTPPSPGSVNPIGGNVKIEGGVELILPIPFVADTRSVQLVAFVDAGNVFSTDCGRDQPNCFDVDLGELAASYGLGFTWISGFGPLTFSIAEPINEGEYDETSFFDFTIGAGF